MKVSPSLFVPPIKILSSYTGGVERVLGDLVWYKVRYGSFLWNCSGFVRYGGFLWNCSGFVRNRLTSFGVTAFDVFRLCLTL